MEDKEMSRFSLALMMWLFGMMCMLIICVLLDMDDREPSPCILEQPQMFNDVEYDYKIDLRPSFIVVYSDNGAVDTVAFGQLEEFFKRDNM